MLTARHLNALKLPFAVLLIVGIAGAGAVSWTRAQIKQAERTDEDSAFQLGYLIGAVRKGAKHTNGIQLEIVRKLEGTVTYDDPALLAAARRGAIAGERDG